MTEVLLLIVSLGLVLACGAFVAAEFSFVTVDRSTVERAVEEGDAGARGVQTRSTASPRSSRAPSWASR